MSGFIDASGDPLPDLEIQFNVKEDMKSVDDSIQLYTCHTKYDGLYDYISRDYSDLKSNFNFYPYVSKKDFDEKSLREKRDIL